MQQLLKAGTMLGLFKDDQHTPELKTAYLEHISEHGLNFATQEEFNFRMELFAKKDKFIKEHNADESQTHEVGHNMFSTCRLHGTL